MREGVTSRQRLLYFWLHGGRAKMPVLMCLVNERMMARAGLMSRGERRPGREAKKEPMIVYEVGPPWASMIIVRPCYLLHDLLLLPHAPHARTQAAAWRRARAARPFLRLAGAGERRDAWYSMSMIVR